MVINLDTTSISLIILLILIISFFSWLVIKTLKEGRKALKDIRNER